MAYALITGASKGIGKEIANELAMKGYDLLLIARNSYELQMVKEEFEKKYGLKVDYLVADLSDIGSVDRIVAWVEEKQVDLRILVNNAGITKDKSLLKMTQEDWHQVIDINLTGVFNCTKAVVQSMVDNKFGRILCASSVVGITGNFGQTNYVATKSALIGMVKTWAKELAKHNITANAIAPGFIKTDMTDLIPEDVKKNIESGIPARRMGQPVDIAHAYLFLASDDAAYINGQCLSVNGGMA